MTQSNSTKTSSNKPNLIRNFRDAQKGLAIGPGKVFFARLVRCHHDDGPIPFEAGKVLLTHALIGVYSARLALNHSFASGRDSDFVGGQRSALQRDFHDLTVNHPAP